MASPARRNDTFDIVISTKGENDFMEQGFRDGSIVWHFGKGRLRGRSLFDATIGV
jgi:hypothetical protein